MELVFARARTYVEEVWLSNDVYTAEVEVSTSVKFVQIILFVIQRLILSVCIKLYLRQHRRHKFCTLQNVPVLFATAFRSPNILLKLMYSVLEWCWTNTNCYEPCYENMFTKRGPSSWYRVSVRLLIFVLCMCRHD
jgi:hypothetical protein